MGNIRLLLLFVIIAINLFQILASDTKTGFTPRKHIKKCCRENMYILHRKRCGNYTEKLHFSIPVYDANIKDTGKTIEETFVLEPFAFENRSFLKPVIEVTLYGFTPYVVEDGVMHLEFANAYNRWTLWESDNYCIDYIVPSPFNNKTVPSLGVWGVFKDEAMSKGNRYLTIGMSISCIFLVLLLVVYMYLPELRNLGGLVLMAYVFSLLWAFILLMTIQRGGYSVGTCVGITVSTYYFFLASFCWMNIMSYDIWWTFRGYAKARPIHRRGEKFKFAMYSLYAWGVPLAMSIMLLVLNFVDLRHFPWFVTPGIPDKGCFIEGGEKLLYLYVPMLIMILLNWLLFSMTAFNIWRLSRGTAVLDSAAAGSRAAHRTHRHRLLVYLKLSILMGLNWILEVLSSFKPDLDIWIVSDMYNLLIGFAIFLIFVCKKKIFKKLIKKYRAGRQSTFKSSLKSRSSVSSRSNSTTEAIVLSQETQPLQIVCVTPVGPMNHYG